jgi:hypothetical protein
VPGLGSSFQKVQATSAPEANSNALFPFSKGRIFLLGFKPLFGKGRKGRFFAETVRNYLPNFRTPHWFPALKLPCDSSSSKPPTPQHSPGEFFE